jgi:signal transduction histidine kinase
MWTMKDKDKTKEQLTKDLCRLREQLVNLERLEAEHKLTEHQREVSLRVLELLNRTIDLNEVKRQILWLIKESSGCEAVGIRLQEGEDFPYYDTVGFVEGHVPTENYLYSLDKNGEIIRDAEGKAVLECMCGNIIRGRFDVTKPFFTERGSFWTNSTTDLLATTTEEELLTKLRNRCHDEGYESVAMIPLKFDGDIIGLLQINDRQCGRFTLELIKFYEGITESIGVVLNRKRMQEQLRHSQLLSTMGEMTAGIAHEVNNPLGSILLYSELIMAEELSPRANRDLRIIHNEAKRAARIMTDLLSYSRRLEPQMYRINLHSVLKKVLDMRRYVEKVQNISAATNFLDSPLYVECDPDQLIQVFMNIILNAEEALKKPDGGNITITTTIDKKWAKVSIADDGTGIPEKNFSQIFYPFFTTKPIGEGTGLGLSTCYGIVTAHNGLIHVENNKMGGATFTVELPLAKVNGKEKPTGRGKR